MKISLVPALIILLLCYQNCAKPNDLAQSDVVASSAGTCSLGGFSISNGAFVPAYSISSGASEADCNAAQETRTCTNGVLSGSFTNTSCTIVSTSGSTVNLTLPTNASNYNLFIAAGSPTQPVTVVLTVNSGVYVNSSSPSIAALNIGSFPLGSTIQIVNNGYIVGAGGAGGNGGALEAPATTSATPGGAGGPAISLGYSATITNNGVIGGGGGGGGGGAGCQVVIGAGGGGGGEGGANPGIGSGQGAYGYPGANGTAGTITAAGTGGSAGVIRVPDYCNNGGGGGSYGQPGAAGLANSVYDSSASIPGAGGAAGAAVIKNGFTATFTAGGSAPNLLGAVSN